MAILIVVAGPNGAGKTSFANEYVRTVRTRLAFVNADEIAFALAESRLPRDQIDMAAGRIMLKRIDELVADGVDFMFETTLATLSYARKIPRWQGRGYSVSLIYLQLPDVEQSIARVQKRVASGGHDVPEPILRRRFDKSLRCLETIYKPLVDEWHVWKSLEGRFEWMESWVKP